MRTGRKATGLLILLHSGESRAARKDTKCCSWRLFLFLGDEQSFMRQASLIRTKKIIFFLNDWSINWRVTNFNLNCFAACCVVEADQRPGWLYLYCFLSSHNHVSSWWHKTSQRICFCCREAQKATWPFYCGHSSRYWLQSQTNTCFHHWFVEKIYCELA